MENASLVHLNFMRILLHALILFVSSPVFSQNKDVTGCYSSNFAVIGWFGIHLELKSDSTFYYTHKGDLLFDGATGIYQVKGKIIQLFYDIPKYDTLYFKYTDTLNQIDSISIPQRVNHLEQTRPYTLIYKRNKLLLQSKEGEKIKKKTDRKGRLQKYYLKVHKRQSETEW